MNKPIFAGADEDAEIKLFVMEDDKPRRLTLDEWIAALEKKGLKPGELQPVAVGESDDWIRVEHSRPQEGRQLLMYRKDRYGAREGEYTATSLFVDVFGN